MSYFVGWTKKNVSEESDSRHGFTRIHKVNGTCLSFHAEMSHGRMRQEIRVILFPFLMDELFGFPDKIGLFGRLSNKTGLVMRDIVTLTSHRASDLAF